MSNFKNGFIKYGLDHGHIKPITINAGDIIEGKKSELEKIIPDNNYNPNDSYKKAINTLKRKVKK
jgi:methylmalonyl-CoA mutase cobalamin-binding subunit